MGGGYLNVGKRDFFCGDFEATGIPGKLVASEVGQPRICLYVREGRARGEGAPRSVPQRPRREH